jgi:RNA polymerase sigma-70 factor (ECF subfamily)
VTVLSMPSPMRTLFSPARQRPSGETLINRIGQGDKLAMHELFISLRTRVYRFILRIVREQSLAEDLVGEVFLDVWRQAGRYEGRSSASTWVLSIARNKAFSALRQKARKEVGIENAAEIPDQADDPETTLQRQSNGAIFRQCLLALSVKHAEVIDLVYYQNRSVKEVAAIIHIPENTVKTRMHLARKHLAKVLEAAGYVRCAS